MTQEGSESIGVLAFYDVVSDLIGRAIGAGRLDLSLLGDDWLVGTGNTRPSRGSEWGVYVEACSFSGHLRVEIADYDYERMEWTYHGGVDLGFPEPPPVPGFVLRWGTTSAQGEEE